MIVRVATDSGSVDRAIVANTDGLAYEGQSTPKSITVACVDVTTCDVIATFVDVPKEHTSVGIYPEGDVLFEEGEPSANNLLLLEDRTCQ